MEAFKGKWQCTADDITGLDEYLVATEHYFPKEMYTKRFVVELFNEGDLYCVTMTEEDGPPIVFKAKPGERAEVSYPGIGNFYMTISFKDNVIYQKQEMKDYVVDCKFYLQDGNLVMEQTANGKTMFNRMRKI